MRKRACIAVLTLVLGLAIAAGCGKKSDTGAGAGSPAPTAATGGAAPAPTAATGGATTAPSPTAAAGAGGAATVDATAIFKANCVPCHGDNLEGKLGPNTNLQKIGSQKSRDQIVTQIKNGGGGMPPFQGKLKDAEINALADWLAAKK